MLAQNTIDELYTKWASLRNIFRYQPINLVKDYFGEEIALHFAWVGMLIASLWIPVLFGLASFAEGLYSRYIH